MKKSPFWSRRFLPSTLRKCCGQGWQTQRCLPVPYLTPAGRAQ